jgi:hypothetical protein
MITPARFNSVHWMLLAVLALAPTAVFAQQDNASRGQSQQSQGQPEAAQPKTEDAQKQTEAAQVKTDTPQAQTEGAQPTKDPKVISGMSILGNQEAPKALVIIPWKGSELGNARGVSTMLDDSRLPIDKEVFMRMLSYYEIRSEKAGASGAPTTTNAAQLATAAANRRK